MIKTYKLGFQKDEHPDYGALHRAVYGEVKDISNASLLLLCIEERAVAGVMSTSFGVASLDRARGVVCWGTSPHNRFVSTYTTMDLQRRNYPALSDEEIFDIEFGAYTERYTESVPLNEERLVVADEVNYQRCLGVLDRLHLEHEETS